MSEAPSTPDWWQASDGRWYPPPHSANAAAVAPVGAASPSLSVVPPAAIGTDAPTSKGNRSWMIVVVLGVVLLVVGVMITYRMLGTTMGPAGMCGSVFDSVEMDRVGPCKQLLESQSLKAGLVGGGLAVIGVITGGIGFVLRSRNKA